MKIEVMKPMEIEATAIRCVIPDPFRGSRLASGESHRAIGRSYGVSHQTIGKVARGKTWRDEFPRGST